MSFDSVRGNQADAGAGAFGGHIQTASANFTVGAVGFGPAWNAEDAMAESIVRMQRELEECQAQCALYEAERVVLANELRQLREEVAKYQSDEDDYVQLTARGIALLEGRQ